MYAIRSYYDQILIGTSGIEPENFKGAIANVRLYDEPMTADQISELYAKTQPKGLKRRNNFV